MAKNDKNTDNTTVDTTTTEIHPVEQHIINVAEAFRNVTVPDGTNIDLESGWHWLRFHLFEEFKNLGLDLLESWIAKHIHA